MMSSPDFNLSSPLPDTPVAPTTLTPLTHQTHPGPTQEVGAVAHAHLVGIGPPTISSQTEHKASIEHHSLAAGVASSVLGTAASTSSAVVGEISANVDVPKEVTALFNEWRTAFEAGDEEKLKAFYENPGVNFSYSNYGFLLLGAVVARCSEEKEAVGLTSSETGDDGAEIPEKMDESNSKMDEVKPIDDKVYYKYVQENIFKKAGTEQTEFLLKNDARVAIPYTEKDGELKPTTDEMPLKGSPAGGAYSTMKDIRKFANALDSGTLLEAESKEKMLSKSNEDVENYGFGCFKDDIEGLWYGHPGGIGGFTNSQNRKMSSIQQG